MQVLDGHGMDLLDQNMVFIGMQPLSASTGVGVPIPPLAKGYKRLDMGIGCVNCFVGGAAQPNGHPELLFHFFFSSVET